MSSQTPAAEPPPDQPPGTPTGPLAGPPANPSPGPTTGAAPDPPTVPVTPATPAGPPPPSVTSVGPTIAAAPAPALPGGPPPPAPLPTPPNPQLRALQLFVQARIGGEPIGSTATSDLMLQTVAKTLGAAGSLADSPELGISSGKPITKLLRAAGVAVYLLTDTLASRGLKRGLGLAVLALGGALVAIALLSGAAPAWLATAGFGILLGGLAYAALSSGMLSLALVLATPVVPLLVWSRMQGGPQDDSGPSRLVQVGLIVMLILTALVMGTVRTPDARPTVSAWLRVVGTVVAVTAAVAAVVWFVRSVELPRWLGVTILVACAVGVVLLALAALRHLQSVATTVAAAIDPAAQRRAHAAAWSWTYGAAYVVFALLVGVVLRLVPPAEPAANAVMLSLLGTFAVLAVFCFLVCLRTRVPPEAPTGP